jgi:hypothetical protein
MLFNSPHCLRPPYHVEVYFWYDSGITSSSKPIKNWGVSALPSDLRVNTQLIAIL